MNFEDIKAAAEKLSKIDTPKMPYIQVSKSLRMLTGRDILRIEDDYFIVSQEWLDALPKSEGAMLGGIPVHTKPRPSGLDVSWFFGVENGAV